VYHYYRENSISRATWSNARREFRKVTHRIAIPIQGSIKRTHSEVWSQLATIS
jgi:hypothetical protein